MVEEVDVGGGLTPEEREWGELAGMRAKFYQYVGDYDLASSGEGDMQSVESSLESAVDAYSNALSVENYVLDQGPQAGGVDVEEQNVVLDECRGGILDARRNPRDRADDLVSYEDALRRKAELFGEKELVEVLSAEVQGGAEDAMEEHERRFERRRNRFYQRVADYDSAQESGEGVEEAQQALEEAYGEYLTVLMLENMLASNFLGQLGVNTEEVDEELLDCRETLDNVDSETLPARVEAIGRYERLLSRKAALSGVVEDDVGRMDESVERLAVAAASEEKERGSTRAIVRAGPDSQHERMANNLFEHRLGELEGLLGRAWKEAMAVKDDEEERGWRWEAYDRLAGEFVRVKQLGPGGYWSELEGQGVLDETLGRFGIAKSEPVVQTGAPEPEGVAEPGEIESPPLREPVTEPGRAGDGNGGGGEPEGGEGAEENPLSIWMVNLRKRREDVEGARQEYELANKAPMAESRERKKTWGALSPKKKKEKYEASYGRALSSYEKAVSLVNIQVEMQSRRLGVSDEDELMGRVQLLGREARDLYRRYKEREQDGASLEERARLLKEYDLISDQRLGIFIKLAQREGRDPIPGEPRETTLLTAAGNPRNYVVREIKPLVVIGGEEENPSKVEITYPSGRMMDFVSREESDMEGMLDKRGQLKEAGIPVVPDNEMYRSEDEGTVFISDPSRGGGHEAVCLPELELVWENHDRDPEVIPDWLRSRGSQFADRMVENAQRAASRGLLINPNAYWFTYNPNQGKIGLKADFLDEVEYKGWTTEALMSRNMQLIRDMFAVRFGLMTEAEWDEKYPEYAADKRKLH